MRFPFLFFCSFLTFTAFAQVRITDDLQRVVQLDRPAKRIVSLAPSITESLFAIGAGEKVIGVTDFCNYPDAATAKQRIGGMINPSIEAIVGLKPDLILLSMEGNVREDFTKLTNLGIPVFVTNPRTLEGIHKSIQQLGILSGHQDQAQALVASMAEREKAVRALARRYTNPKTLLVVSITPLIVVGSRTYLSELLAIAGAENVAGSSGMTYPTLSRETVITSKPDVLILLGDLIKDVGEITALYPEWSLLPAVKAGRVFEIDADVVSRPGPRVVDALELLSTLLHRGIQ